MRTVARPFLAVLVCVLLGVSPASAEWYIGGYGGVAIPNSEDVDLNVTDGVDVLTGTLQNVDLDNSVVFGGKVGYFFGPAPSFGVELDGYHFSPDAGAQTVNFSGTFNGIPVTITDTIDKIDVGVTGIGLNVIWRPFPGNLQPYVGVGGVAAIGNLETTVNGTSISDTDVVAGFQALAGLKWFPIPQLGIFIEYKFLLTGDFEFSDTVAGVTETLKTDLIANMFYGGIAWHFH